jgi:hypothetical protein
VVAEVLEVQEEARAELFPGHQPLPLVVVILLRGQEVEPGQVPLDQMEQIFPVKEAMEGMVALVRPAA